MIDKSKYLYWLNKDDPQIDGEVVWRELYSKIGCFFHTVQMVEYNIANIISIEEFEKEEKKIFSSDDIIRIKDKINIKFDKLTKFTFGNLVNEVEKSKYLEDVNIDLLKNIKQYRDYLAHRCFKEKLLENELDCLEDVDKFVDELNDYEQKAKQMNDCLVEIFKKYKIKTILMKY